MSGINRRIDAIERAITPAESQNGCALILPGETHEETLARCPWAKVLIPMKEPLAHPHELPD